MNLGIVGGRDFNNKGQFTISLNSFMCEHKVNKIITGDANGADKLAREFAKDVNIDLIVHKANWKEYGKAAGAIRNKEIWKDSDVIIAFWDGKSKGTKQTIDNFKGELIVVRY